jgi:hypothetical protein
MMFFNFIGIGMLIAAFGVAYAIALLIGDTSESVLLVIAAPILLASDLS